MKKYSLKKTNYNHKFDPWLALIAVFLSLFGLVMIFEASNVSAFRDFNNKYYYVKEQATWLVVGITVMIITSQIHYKNYFRLSLPLLVLALISLVAVFIPGLGIKTLGASRWVSLGPFSFQPSELTKLAMIIYLSNWLSNPEKGRLGAFLLLMGLIVGLVLLQPDMGTAVIISSIFLMVYYLSGAPLWHIGMLIPFFFAAAVILAVASPYRFARLTTFFNPNSDPLGASYHIRQILLSLGSGGFWGVGLGSSRQKYQYLPEASTDSIFAIIAEEFGFLGSSVFILVCLIFLYKIFKIAKHAPNRQSFLLAGGILAFFGFQMLINFGSMVTLFPLTGVPLPFISYGGSSLTVSLIAVGILVNIGRQSRKL